MPDNSLQIYLPAFLLAFLLVTFFWKRIRKFMRLREYSDIEKKVNYHRIKRIDKVYKVIFMVFMVMIAVYAYYPELYYLFIPLNPFDHPFINSIGLLTLKAAFIWIVVAQIHIDKELYKYSRDLGNMGAMELVYYSERLLLGGLALMFTGMFITLTNVIGIVAGLVSVLLYFRIFSPQKLKKA